MTGPPIPVRVTDKRQETADTWTLRLEPAPAGFAPAIARLPS